MPTKKDNDSFLQPILSVLGLIVSGFSAISPMFAQAQLSKFFIDDRLSLPASMVSIVFGILLSWWVINIKGIFRIPIGIKKERGAGYLQPWKEINNNNVFPVVLIISTILFFAFFAIGHNANFLCAVIQVVVYIIFFTIIIGTFSLLIAQTKNQFQWEQEVANTGSLVYATLERNGAVNSGIRIIQNNQIVDVQELITLGLNPGKYLLIRKLVVETVSQESKCMEVLVSPDYQELISARTIPDDCERGSSNPDRG